MHTVRDAFQKTRNVLGNLYSAEEVHSITSLLFQCVFNVSNKDLLLKPDLVFEHNIELEGFINRLLAEEPLQHIIGYEEFLGMKILVGQDVLIPRPETEELMEWVFNDLKVIPTVIADICSGSGCIALSLRGKFTHAEIIAIDISEKALEMSLKSELLNFSDTKIKWEKHDILKEEWLYPMPDVLVCNPPYIKVEEKSSMAKNVLEYEPHTALFVDDDDPLLFYKQVIKRFGIVKGIHMYFELNPLTAFDLKNYTENLGYTCLIRDDMSGKPRFAKITR